MAKINPKNVISIDIGSTWTKGALFNLDEHNFTVSHSITVPTTQENLTYGFKKALTGLVGQKLDCPLEALADGNEVFFSSSAKGGLGIAAIGLVPDLTLQLARLAATSAGGKVVKSFSYLLTMKDVEELERINPDIILLSGGSDGGNKAYIVENARKLAASTVTCPVVFAGNRAAADEAARILKEKDVLLTENLMPEVGQVNIEPAREIIRKIFLERIIRGRGLTEIVRAFGNQPRPTPLAVFELIEAIPVRQSGWNDIAAIDIGGATTDFYSNTESFLDTDRVVLKGIREPRIKRTVEGDLGLRVSASYLWEAGRGYIEERLQEEGFGIEAMAEFVARILNDTDLIPASGADYILDRILAEACVYYSTLRHAGSWRETYTPQGKVYVQTGKDLRRVRAVIGSGGYLARTADADAMRIPFEKLKRFGDETKLLPEAPLFFRDRHHLFPLLGNLVERYPEEATALAVASLEQLSNKGIS